MSLHSSSQQPPGIYVKVRSAPAVNRTRHEGSVTCARHVLAQVTDAGTCRQVYLLCRREKHLAGFTHPGVEDRWLTAPKRARYSALIVFSLMEG